MTPSPPIQDRSDNRHSCWLSAGSLHARIGSPDRTPLPPISSHKKRPAPSPLRAHSCSKRPFRKPLSGVQLVEQRLSLLQIERVKTFGEPAVDRSEKIAGLIPLALTAPQPRHAHRRAQFPGFCLLLTRDRQRALEIHFRLRR